jgi:hypothetical protein
LHGNATAFMPLASKRRLVGEPLTVVTKARLGLKIKTTRCRQTFVTSLTFDDGEHRLLN